MWVVVAEFQPHGRKRYALALHVPESHGEGQEALVQTEEEVRVEYELRVNEAVFLDVAGRAEHQVGFGLLVSKSDGGSAVGQAADDDHEERR